MPCHIPNNSPRVALGFATMAIGGTADDATATDRTTIAAAAEDIWKDTNWAK